MSVFLSPEWIRELDQAARASDALKRSADTDTLVVEQRVTGGPTGDVTYHVVLGPAARVESGTAHSPDVILITDYDTASAVQAGSLNAQRAIAAGRMKVHGHMGVLLRHAEALRAVGDIFRDVRAATEAPSAPESRR
jgi:putative sterol carrier protein